MTMIKKPGQPVADGKLAKFFVQRAQFLILSAQGIKEILLLANGRQIGDRSFRRVDDNLQIIERFQNVIEGALLERRDRIVDRRMTCHDDELGEFRHLFDFAQQLNARHFWHPDVAENDLVPFFLEFLQRILAVLRQGNDVTFVGQQLANQAANRQFVVSNQNIHDVSSTDSEEAATDSRVKCSGNSMTNRAPPLSAFSTLMSPL